jgi:MFS transporter, MHS family, shikimate and dehydroshikimate transport protein
VSLLALGGGSPHWVVAYMAVLGLITAVSVALGPETFRTEMFPERPSTTNTEAAPQEAR